MLERPEVQRFIAMGHKRSLPPKKTLMHAGDPAQSLYLILEGSVSVLLEDHDGREIVLAYLSPGDFFGEMCLFPEQEARSAMIRTRTPTLVAEMHLGSFQKFALDFPQIMFAIAGQLSARLRDTSRRVADLSFLDVAGRVARNLIDLADRPDAQKHPLGKVIKLSRQELGRLAGCSREMAGRVLKRFEEDGMIQSSGRSIVIIEGRKSALRAVTD